MKGLLLGAGAFGGPARGCVRAYSPPALSKDCGAEESGNHLLVWGTPKFRCFSARRVVVMVSLSVSTL
jgi:hypothetical protein